MLSKMSFSLPTKWEDFFLCGQIAYGKQLGIVHSSENKLFLEKVFQNAILAAYQVGGLFLCGQTE